MKKLIAIIGVFISFLSLAACKDKDEPTPDQDNTSDTNQDDNTNNDTTNKPNVDITEIVGGGTFGVVDANATTFTFNSTELEVPAADCEYLPVGTYGTNNFFTMGGDIRMRVNSAFTEVKSIELENNTMGWIEFKITENSTLTIKAASSSSANSSKLVIAEKLEDKKFGNLQKLHTLVDNAKIDSTGTAAIVSTTEQSIVTAYLQPGVYRLFSPSILDKNDVCYRKNLRIMGLTVSPGIEITNKVLLNMNTLQDGVYYQNIGLFNGDWGTINATADQSTDSKGKASGHITVEANNKKCDDMEFTTRLKTGGSMAKDGSSRAIIITLNQKTVVTTYAMSSNKETSRVVSIFDESFTPVTTFEDVTGVSLNPYTYTLEAGKYYLSSDDGGLNIYGFLLSY